MPGLPGVLAPPASIYCECCPPEEEESCEGLPGGAGSRCRCSRLPLVDDSTVVVTAAVAAGAAAAAACAAACWPQNGDGGPGTAHSPPLRCLPPAQLAPQGCYGPGEDACQGLGGQAMEAPLLAAGSQSDPCCYCRSQQDCHKRCDLCNSRALLSLSLLLQLHR